MVYRGEEYTEKRVNKFFNAGTFVLLIGIILFLIILKQEYIIIKNSFTAMRWHSVYNNFSTSYYLKISDGEPLKPGMSAESFNDYLIKNLNIKKTCNNSIEEGCWPEFSFSYKGDYIDFDSSSPGFITKDGVLVSHLLGTNPECLGNKLCSAISIDINGHAGPNVYGKDQFRLYYFKDKLVPYLPEEETLMGPAIKTIVGVS